MSQPTTREEERRPDYPKADMIQRSVARLIDLAIAIVCARLLPDVAGALVSVGYLLLADGILKGQSPGKRLAGVKVINRATKNDALFRESIIRNLPFAVVGVFWYIPILGLILVPVGGLFVFAFELYMAFTDRLGLRIGDVLAETQVIDASVPVESLEQERREREASPRRMPSRRASPPEPEGAV